MRSFCAAIGGTVPAAYVANIAVFAQKRKAHSEAFVRIDSLDVVPVLR